MFDLKWWGMAFGFDLNPQKAWTSYYNLDAMILITGGTGFIGKALIRHLAEMNYEVRTLLRPSQSSPKLPEGIPIEVTVSSLMDERGLRAAMVGVDAVYHLASSERLGGRSDLIKVEIQGTRAVVEAALDAGVKRIFYVSHLGADRASAFPALKAKAIAEEFIRRSGLQYTILRSAVVFGPNDGLTSGISSLLASVPFLFFVPGNGKVLLQPIWIEDLATCLSWAMEDPGMLDVTMEVGGPEYLTFRQVVEMVMRNKGVRRRLVGIPPPYIRGLTVFMESMASATPTTVYWLDYLAANRTTALDTLPRVFGLMPSRMSARLAYLQKGTV